jgi:hypothetical protein
MLCLALCGASAAQAATRCAKFDSPDTAKHAKPSSFAPHAHSGSHVYGTPIEKPILKHRPKPKPQVKSEPQLKSEPELKSEPQLRSEPLPQG